MVTPLDWWRAGFDLWLRGIAWQIEVQQRTMAAMLPSVRPSPCGPTGRPNVIPMTVVPKTRRRAPSTAQ